MLEEKKRYFFKEGEAVCHIDNLGLKMNVEKAVFKIYDRPKLSNPSEKESIKKILGIKVHWFEGNVLHKEMFHKHLLVPWDIACGATYAEIQKWIGENHI